MTSRLLVFFLLCSARVCGHQELIPRVEPPSVIPSILFAGFVLLVLGLWIYGYSAPKRERDYRKDSAFR